MNDFERQGIEAAATAAASIPESQDIVTLSSGVILRVRKVSPLLIRRAVQQIPAPPVPIFHDPDRDRDIENPSHPDYLAALEEQHTAQGLAGFDMMVLMGTELVSVPDDIDHLDNDDWIDKLRAVGIDPDISTKPKRYLSWIQLIALTDMADMARITMAVGRLTVVREGDVQLAVDSFRSDEERRSAVEPELSESAANGHRV